MWRLCLLISAVACTPALPESTPVNTTALTADIHFFGLPDSTTEATVSLTAPGHAKGYTVEHDDELIWIIGDLNITLVRDTNADEVIYTGVHYAAPTDLDMILSYQRDSGENAQKSSVRLPERLFVQAPQTWSRATPLALEWTTNTVPDDVYTIDVRGDCLDNWFSTATSAGGTIDAGAVAGEGNCDATVLITRSRRGALDDDWRGGEIWAHQEHALSIPSTP